MAHSIVYFKAFTRSLLNNYRFFCGRHAYVSETSILATSVSIFISSTLLLEISILLMRIFYASFCFRKSWYCLFFVSPIAVILASISSIFFCEYCLKSLAPRNRPVFF